MLLSIIFADRKNTAPAQISLAWMLHKYPNVVPIPGSKNKERIIENLNASDVELTDEEFKRKGQCPPCAEDIALCIFKYQHS